MKSKLLLIPYALAIFGVFLHCLRPDVTEHLLSFYQFQARDVHRALELLRGHWIFYGPEMTGGGNLPGPLYYFFLALSLLFDPTWISAWYGLLVLWGLSAVAGWFFLRRVTSDREAFLWVAMLAFSALSHRFVMIFLNVSYMIPFTVLAAVCFCLAYGNDGKRRDLAFIAGCFITGLAIQFHFSIASYVFAVSLIQFLPRLTGLRPQDPRVYWRGLAAFTVPLIPYLVWLTLRQFHIPLGQPSAFGGSSEWALPSLVVLTGYVANVPIERFLNDGFMHILEAFPFILFPALATFGWARRRGHKIEIQGVAAYLRVLTLFAICSFPAFFYWWIAPIGCRYGMPFYIPLLFITTLLFYVIAQSPGLSRICLVLTGIVFGVCCFYFAGFHSDELEPRLGVQFVEAIGIPSVLVLLLARRQRRTAFLFAICLAVTFLQDRITREGDVSATVDLMPHQYQWLKIWENIYAETGWSFSTAIHRTYFVNHHIEQDAEPPYAQAITNAGTSTPKKTPPDGYIVDAGVSPGDIWSLGLKKWLLQQNVQKEVKLALEAGELQLEQPLVTDILIIPYRVVKENILPSHFHDYGEAYARDPREGLLDQVPGNESVKPTQPGTYVFKWNECPEHDPFCSTGAVVRLLPAKKGEARLDVTVLGQAISQVSPWISPNWTQGWVAPYVAVTCGGKREKRELASTIGYSRKYAGDKTHLLLLGNNSFVAPFERELSFACDGKIDAISVGREGSAIETIYKLKSLPGRELTARM